jgi:hypothetical protein
LNRINQILQEWPSGTIITSDWLKKRGVYSQLAQVYENSGWIERINRGAYKRKGDRISWEGGLYALQELQHLPIHVGGRTAIELQGLSHYIKTNRSKVVLWKLPELQLPTWFQTYHWNVNLVVRSTTLFGKEVEFFTTQNVNQITITVSSVERAILEYLYDVPKHEGFDEANYIMEGLASLRPQVLRQLLENCRSIKVKRLFMYIAEHYNHGWVKRIDTSNIDFGRGKREIIKGSHLNKKYKIVVPKLYREDR